MQNKNKVNFTIRIDKELKDRFVKVCKQNDTDSSKEIRRFVKTFLEQHAQKKFNF
jgi:antitoxin component of RelBE/YafQ-DinJ toxin-antitoxin module